MPQERAGEPSFGVVHAPFHPVDGGKKILIRFKIEGLHQNAAGTLFHSEQIFRCSGQNDGVPLRHDMLKNGQM